MGPWRRAARVPMVIVVFALLASLVAAAFVVPATTPAPAIAPEAAQRPRLADGTLPPLPTPIGRYPPTQETAIVGSCVAGIDPNVVPDRVAQAFCICTLNVYEQLNPTYDRFQQGITSGAITDDIRTQIANRCAQAVVGG